jgi:hypothetical protein
MKDYRVYGDRLYKYYVDIAADSPEIALEGSESIPTDGWNRLIDDSVIEPYSVVALEELDKTDISDI